MPTRTKRRQLQGIVAMPDANRQTPRVRGLLIQVASELSDCKLELVFAQEKLPTHFLLRRNLRRLVARADFVLCVTDGQDPDVVFEAGLAFGLQKPLLLVILPETRILPATFMGHFYVELCGDASDHDRLQSAMARLVALRSAPLRAGRSRPLSRMGCGVGASNGRVG